jgi:outer membrane protein TolC
MPERRDSPGGGGHQRDGDRMPGWAHYVQPFLRLPAHWSGVDEVAQPTTGEELKTDLAQWRRSFNDPLLNELIARALSSNLDEKIAVSCIHEEREYLVMSRTGFFPSVELSGSYTRRRYSANTPFGEFPKDDRLSRNSQSS